MRKNLNIFGDKEDNTKRPWTMEHSYNKTAFIDVGLGRLCHESKLAFLTQNFYQISGSGKIWLFLRLLPFL